MKFDFTDSRKVLRRCVLMFTLFAVGLISMYLVQLALGVRTLDYVLTYSATAIAGSAIGVSLIYIASRVHRK